MNKFYICGLSQEGELNNLKELLGPIYSFYDGLNWVHHNPKGETSDYLESMKKDGKIIYNDWNFRLNDSRNRYLFNGTMKTGDWFCNIDCLERISPDFFKSWQNLKNLLELNGIDGVVLHNKRFIFKFNEYLEFAGNPHEYIKNTNRVVELTSIKPYDDLSWYFTNVRSQKRDKYHFVFSYLNYLVNFPCSNQFLLGNDDNKEAAQIEREVGIQFRYYLEQNNYLPLTIDKFKFLCNNKMDDIREFLNKSKICNDAYRFLALGRTDFKDDHNFSDKILV